MTFFNKKYVRCVIAGIIFFVATFFSVYKLSNSPPVWYDEGFYEQAAMNIAQHQIWGIQAAPNVFQSLGTVTAGYPLLLPIALSFKLFGIGVLQARGVMVIFILSFLGVVFLFVKKEKGFYLSMGSLALLATYPTLYGNGKTVLGEVPGLLYLMVSLLLLNYWVENKSGKYALAAGIFLGLAMSSKLSFLLTGLPSVILLLVYLYKIDADRIKNLLLYLFGILFTLFIWIQTQFGSNDSIHSFFVTTFRHYDGPSGSTLLLQNIWRFFTEVTPLYALLTIGVWYCALFIRWRQKNKISEGELFASFFTLLNVGVYLLSPGWYRYLFPAQVIALIFFPASLSSVLSVVFKNKKLIQGIIISTILFLSAVQFYQVAFSSFVATYYKSDRTQKSADAFSRLPQDKTYFIYNLPEIVIFLPKGLVYYQYLNSHPIFGIGREYLVELSKGTPDAVIMYLESYNQNKSLFTSYPVQQKITDRYILLLKK
jgi:hypothetical protein